MDEFWMNEFNGGIFLIVKSVMSKYLKKLDSFFIFYESVY